MHVKKARQLLTLLLGMALVLSMLLPALAAASVPQPTEDFYFYDEPDVFSKKLEATIIEENARLEEAYNVQLVMVAMQTLDGADIKDFTVSLMDSWQIGGEEGKGLVLVLDIDGDNYFTIAGEGLRSFLTSDVLQRLLDRNLEESFAMKNYDAGVGSFFEAVTQRIEEEFGVPAESTSTEAPGETTDASEGETEAVETQPAEQTEPAETQAVTTEAIETTPAETQTTAECSSGGSGFWGVVKAVFWIAVILLALLLLAYVILVIRRRRYEKQRDARRRAKQQHRDYDQH